jgi:signal peptidase I
MRLTDSSVIHATALSSPASAAPALSVAAPRRKFWKRPAGRLLLIVLIVTGVRTFVGEASVVPTGSMEGTILIGDHLFLNKMLYGPEVPLLDRRLPRLKSVRRGDIIAFRYPKDPAETYIKRVVAVGGDNLEIRDGRLYVNAQAMNEAYAVHRFPLRSAHERLGPIEVPPGRLFVMGDNRDNSSDSREWGFVPVDNVIGEPLFVYWSYDAPTARWLNQDVGQQMEFYVSVAENFFSRTRWGRTGMLL